MPKSGNNSFYKENTIQSPPLSLRFMRLYLKALGYISPDRAGRKLLKFFLRPRIDKERMIARYEKLELFDDDNVSYLTIEGHDIFVYTEGIPEVLLVHGWESSGHRFENLMERLRKENIGFVFFDLPAHGYSSGEEIHAVMAANIVAEMLDRHESITSIVGHSFGGGISYLALEESSNVDTLITVATPLNYIAVSEPFFQVFDAPPILREKFNELFSDHIGRVFKNYDFSTIEPANEISLLMIHDKDDQVIPWKDVLDVKDNQPDAEIFLTEGLGHRKLMHAERVISRIVKQLQE